MLTLMNDGKGRSPWTSTCRISLETSVQTLGDFLNKEIDLGITFTDLAKYYRDSGNSERSKISKQNALKALEAIDRFKHRPRPNLISEIETRRSELASAISSL
jgi:hypothetical protein